VEVIGLFVIGQKSSCQPLWQVTIVYSESGGVGNSEIKQHGEVRLYFRCSGPCSYIPPKLRYRHFIAVQQ
jgi:hypothetical protein